MIKESSENTQNYMWAIKACKGWIYMDKLIITAGNEGDIRREIVGQWF